MKRVFLVMVISAMLVTLGFAQTPDAGSNTDPATVKGCLGGSDGNYTVAEDGSRQTFKITASSIDLKPHVGHEVKLIGHKASGAVSSGAADHSLAVTELGMISEHCAAAAAATTAPIIPPSETVIRPVVDPAGPATASAPAVDDAAPVSPSLATTSAPAAPAVTVSPSSPTSTPAADAAAPDTMVSRSSPIVSTPSVDTAAPAVTVSPSSATVSTPPVEAVAPPAVEAASPARTSVHARKLPKAQAAPAAAETAVSPSADTGSPAAADAATSTSPATPPSATASAPDAATPAPTVTHRTGSLSLLIVFVVLVVVLGTLAPLLGRWRKRKMLERTGSPNLSFTNEVRNEESTNETSSDIEKPEPLKVA